MTRKRAGLGRGLDALIPGKEESGLPAGGVAQVPVAQITRNPRQPRAHFDPEEMAELTASIREHGILQPILLTQGALTGEFTLIAGERRLQAARLAGLETVPALVREANEQDLLEIALIENVQRTDLSPLEAAEAYRQLAEDFGLSQEEIAARVGKGRVSIANTMRLLKLAPAAQEALAAEKITEGHARALLGLAHAQAQEAALQTVLKLGFTVRQTEELVRKLTGEKPARPPKPAPPVEIQALEERLRSRLGTRVSLSQKGRSGTLTIHYYSAEELDSLIEMLLGDSE